jgi:group I intron endonuclease
MNLPLISTNSLQINPIIQRLKLKIEYYVKENTELGSYLSINLKRIAALNFTSEDRDNEEKSVIIKVNENIANIDLSFSWDLLKDFKRVPGIYQFTLGTESYIGSTKDIYNRCFIQHKNHAFTSQDKHKKFYNLVEKNGWSKFTLSILRVTHNHVNNFSENFPNYVLTDKDLKILQLLTSYELTVIEQIYLDNVNPTLNSSLFANWSSYNIGSKGYIRTSESNKNLSLAFLNRKYSIDTKELHRKNNTGKRLSSLTKSKMSTSSGGVTVKLIDVNSKNSIVEFKNKSLLAKELNISLRTVNRWLEDGKIHYTRSIKYPKVIIKK